MGLRIDGQGAITTLKQFDDAADKAEQSGSRLERTAGRIKGALAGIGMAAAAGIFYKTVQETIAAQQAMAQLEAVIRSTGGAAGFTAQQLSEHASALQRVTTYGDDAIIGAQALLLTFTRIRGPEFTGATEAVLNMATALGMDLRSAALQVGKALNDPIQGITALSRAGVQFSDDQERMIERLVETGRTAEAQRIILAELETQFGGSARAARDTLGGALAALNNAWGDLFEVSDKASQGTVDGINAITRALENTGLNMDRIISDAVRDWETMRASIEKVHRIMSLPIGPGFFAAAKAIIKEVDDELKETLARLSAPAATGPAPGGGGGGGGDVSGATRRAAEEAKKVAEEAARYKERLEREAREAQERAIEETRRQVTDMTDDLARRMTDAMTGWLGPFRAAVGGAIQSLLSGAMQTRLGGLLGIGMGGERSLGQQMTQEALTGSVAGGLLGYGVGSHMRSGAGGFLVGGLGGAAAGFAVGGPIGAAVGGLTGALGGLIGGLNGSAEAARRAARAQEDYQRSVEMWEAQLTGDTVEQRVLAVQAQADALRRAAEELNRGSGDNIWSRPDNAAELQRELERINELERQHIEKIRATGDAVAYVNGQLVNVASGFKLAGHVFNAMDPLAAMPSTTPTPSAWQPGQPAGDTEVVLMVDGERLGTAVLRSHQRRAATTFGDAALWPRLLVT